MPRIDREENARAAANHIMARNAAAGHTAGFGWWSAGAGANHGVAASSTVTAPAPDNHPNNNNDDDDTFDIGASNEGREPSYLSERNLEDIARRRDVALAQRANRQRQQARAQDMAEDDTSSTNNNSQNNSTAQNASAQRNINLRNIRAQMTPQGLLMASKSKSSFTSYQSENTLLILYLFEKEGAMLVDQFRNELHELDNNISYEHITNPRHPYRGLKTEEQRKVEYRKKTLRDAISHALGPGGTVPRQATVDFQAFTADVETYARYITTTKKKEHEDGEEGYMRAGVYSGYRTALNYLFSRYRFIPSQDFKTMVKNYTDGIVRLANDARQNGEVSNHKLIFQMRQFHI